MEWSIYYFIISLDFSALTKFLTSVRAVYLLLATVGLAHVVLEPVQISRMFPVTWQG